MSWYATLRIYTVYEEEIILQAADIAHALALPFKVGALVAQEPVSALPVPLVGVRTTQVADTWNEAREEGRVHEGVDIFAERGTPIFSVTEGYVMRSGTNRLGGNVVLVLGPGGVRYYYAHLHRAAVGIAPFTHVTTDTVLGFVGNTGNAVQTPSHLHFGVYTQDGPINPYPLLIDR
jgi:murein DD-endopeptidase MepM/ murein hydrolase activator NlpD